MKAIAALAAGQHGAVSRAQALAAGLSSSGIARRAQGSWKVVDDGVYVLPGFPATWAQSVMIACLATGGIASHLTAARLWKLALPVPAAKAVDVTVDAARRPRSTRSVRVHRTRGVLAPVLLEGIPSTDLGPTLIQLAELLDASALEAAVDAASGFSPGVLFWLADTLVASRRGHAASVKMRALISELLPGAESPVPGLMARFPGALRGHLGLDFAWLAPRVGLQIFDHQDHGRSKALDELAGQGWRILVTHDREQPRALVGRVRRALKF